MNLDEIQRRSREIFRQEAADLLGELESALLKLEADPGNPALINRAFRVMHTLKGSGATSGFHELSDFLHRVEDVFDAARQSRLQINPQIIDLTLKLADSVVRYLAAEPADAAAVLAGCSGELTALLSYLPVPKKTTDTAPAPAAAGRFQVRFRPRPDLFRTGSDPGVFLDDLRALGPCIIQGHANEVPPLAKMDPEACYLQWEIEVATEADENAVRGVFDFIEGECDLEITRLGAIEAPAGTVTEPTRVHPFAAPETIRTPAAASPVVPPSPTAPVSTGGRVGAGTLRVPAERLDRLVNLVGELVLLRSQVSTACTGATHLPIGIAEAAEALERLSTEMREAIQNIRVMPIEQTFGRFRRLVRDLARNLGKDVGLVIAGGDTEVDRAVLDALVDPLMHLVRNSLDHGIEPAAERQAAGKPRCGTLRLSAEQQGNRVLVSVSDDGRGLDPERIRARAIRQGLLAGDAQPTETELFQLVFLPGFSTAERITRISGRGVGLDVVRQQVEQLGGGVEIRSERGRGAEFRLSLPLTMAILDGLMVEVDGERYILPFDLVRETIELKQDQRAIDNGGNLVELRGELVPCLRLRDLLHFTSAPPDVERVVVLEIENQRTGLVIDRVLGNHQTVLKSLGWIGRRTPVFSGATVLGDGRIALILDVPALLTHQRHRNGSKPAPGI
jgi:two-component system chemotaxis sensor kinase CheA